MRQQSKDSIVILFVFGSLALNYPFLDLFDRAWMPFGIPLLYLYLYLLWLAIIGVLVVIVRHSQLPSIEPDQVTHPPEESAPLRPETEVADRNIPGKADRPDRPE